MSTGVEAWENVENRYVGKRNVEVTWVNIGGGAILVSLGKGAWEKMKKGYMGVITGDFVVAKT